MTHYDFFITSIDEETISLVIAQPKGDPYVRLNAAALVWEALLPFGNPVTPHPTTGETADEFRARSGDA